MYKKKIFKWLFLVMFCMSTITISYNVGSCQNCNLNKTGCKTTMVLARGSCRSGRTSSHKGRSGKSSSRKSKSGKSSSHKSKSRKYSSRKSRSRKSGSCKSRSRKSSSCQGRQMWPHKYIRRYIIYGPNGPKYKYEYKQ